MEKMMESPPIPVLHGTYPKAAGNHASSRDVKSLELIVERGIRDSA